jgi:N-acetylglutamate synthase/N-acetylornithine aminotransferase
VSSIACWEEKGEVKCEREEDLKRRELEEKIKHYIEDKLKELVEQYEIEVTVDLQSGRGVGRWRKKR